MAETGPERPSSGRRLLGWLGVTVGVLAMLFAVIATFLAIWSHGDVSSRWGATAIFAGMFGFLPFIIGCLEVFGDD